LRAAVAQLDPAAHHVVYVANPAFGTRGLYVTIVRALGALPLSRVGFLSLPGEQ